MPSLTQFHAEGKIQDEFAKWRRRNVPDDRRTTQAEVESFLDYIESERSELLDFKYVAKGGDKRKLVSRWIK